MSHTITEAEHYADEVAAEFVIQADYVTAREVGGYEDRSMEDNYVGISDAIAAEEREASYANYLAANDSDAYNATTVRVEGELMQVVPMDAIYAKQDRVTNFYTDADGFQRTGSVRIKRLATGTPVAECVKCKQTLIYRGDYDRESMEAFTLAAFTHGHNHSAKWVQKTPIRDTVAMSIAHHYIVTGRYDKYLNPSA